MQNAAVEQVLLRTPGRGPVLRSAAAPVPVSIIAPRVQREAARVSSPRDPAEREAESTAKRIMRMEVTGAAARPVDRGTPSVARHAESIRLMRLRGMLGRTALEIARKAEADAAVPPGVSAEIANAKAGGAPLPGGVRTFMEPRFGANFGKVRVHTGDRAATLNRKLAAHAFTHGSHVFFGKDKFKPDTHEGKELIAHELTHTIQQGAVVQRSADVSVTERSSDGVVHRLGMSDMLNFFADKANMIPGYRMFTIVIGVNPINMSEADASPANILRAIVEFMPGGGLITQALDRYGVFDKVGAWIEGQLKSLGISGTSIKAALTQFLDSLGLSDLLNPGGVWDRAKALFSGPIDRIISFVKSLAAQVLDFIRDAILRPLATLAAQSPGWDLLCAVLGKNPITGDRVPPTAENLIGGFMKLIGQEEIWENIKKGNAIARALAWFQKALAGLMGFVNEIPGLFLQALKSLTIQDIVLLPVAIVKVAKAFGSFFVRFVSWAGTTILDLLEIIISVVAPGVLPYIKKAKAAFNKILKDPIGFAGNLVKAAQQGLNQFVSKFPAHLKASLIGWLTGALGGAGVYIPQAFTLVEIGKCVLSVLGITWAQIRGKIVKALGPNGETIMKGLEKGFEIVKALVTGGPAAAWEVIKQQLTDLRDTVLQAIIGYVKDRIIQKAITTLLSMLNPAGAFIQAIIAIYNGVMAFVERLKQIAQVVAAFIDSISAIADGAIGAAANRVEQTLGGLLTLVISFLARLVGLGNVAAKVVELIKVLQAKVDAALEKGITWIVEKAKALFKALFSKKDQSGKPDERTPAQKQADLDKALVEASALQTKPKATEASIKAGLGAIKTKYRMQSLDLVVDSQAETDEAVHFVGAINPTGKSSLYRIQKDGTVGPLGIVRKMLSWKASTLKELLKDSIWNKFKGLKGKYQEASLAIRHKVSISDTIKSTDNAIAPKQPDTASEVLGAKGFLVAGNPKTKPKIRDAARDLLQEANNDLSNLFVGDARINSVMVKERYDAGDTGDANEKEHVAQRTDFVEQWGFKDEDFVITMQRQSKRQGTTRETETRRSQGTQDKKPA